MSRTIKIIALTLPVVLGALGGCGRPLLGPVALQARSRPTSADDASTGQAWDWAQCLHETVRDGRVHYARINEHPNTLDRILNRLTVPLDREAVGTERAAYLINAYNVFAMRAGLERYRAAGGDPDRARAPKETQYRFRLNGRDVTLADVRRRLIGGDTPDVRILLALCPAVAGIPLSDQPFEPATLDRQLVAVAAAAMSDPLIVRVDHENKLLRVSDVIGRNRSLLIRAYELRTGARNASLLNALLDLADDAGRDRLNTAIGYPVAVMAQGRRLNVYVPDSAR